MEKVQKQKKSEGAVRKLASCIGEYKTPSILCAVLVVFEVILEVLIPLVMAQVINVGLVENATEFTFIFEFGKIAEPIFTVYNRIEFICICGAIIIVMALVSLACGILAGKFAAEASSGFAYNVRVKMINKIEKFSFANLDHFNTASIVTRLTTDVGFVLMAYMTIIRTLVRSPIMLVLALTSAITINPRMSIVFAVTLPIILIVLPIGVKLIFPKFMKMLDEYDGMNESTQENLTGIRAVKAFVREDHETEKFRKVSARVQKLQFDAEKWLVIAMPFLQIIIYASILILVWVGGNEIIAGNMQIGYLSSFLTYVMQVFMSLAMVAMVFVTIVMSRASVQRIVEIYDEKIDIEDDENATDDEVADGSIDFENVNFSYSKNPDNLNIENLNLHIKSGERIGILGATGSGKTTLVQLIPRLYDVLDGEVKVGGRNVKEYKIEKLRDSVAVVLQKNVLFSGTIRENLLWGNPDATQEQIEHATKVAQAHDFITSFPNGYETELGQGGVNVSGGQKQRLSIARALLKHPKVMIMDDSTSAVDTATDASIRAGLKNEFGDTTVIIIAQRVASVEDADRIILMENGKIKDIGSHEELMVSSETYCDLYNSQQKGGGDFDVVSDNKGGSDNE